MCIILVMIHRTPPDMHTTVLSSLDHEVRHVTLTSLLRKTCSVNEVMAFCLLCIGHCVRG